MYGKKSLKPKLYSCFVGKGGKNRRRGKNESEDVKRELVFKEDGQGESFCSLIFLTLYISSNANNIFDIFAKLVITETTIYNS